jgi:hypothetical protein
MQQEIKVKNGQSIYDIALFCYNDASLVYDLISENPIITDILMDLTALTLVYTPKKVVKYEAKENTQKANKLVTIKQQQSIFDLSLQQYGSIDFVYNLVENNSFIDSILSNDINGNVLASVNEKNYVTEFYNKNGTVVGTNTSVINYLLQENGFYILQENSGLIIL